MAREAHTRRFDSVFERYNRPRWQPTHRLRDGMGVFHTLPEPCRCDRRLNQPHNEPTCPYIDPDSWYAAEVERMRERAPA